MMQLRLNDIRVSGCGMTGRCTFVLYHTGPPVMCCERDDGILIGATMAERSKALVSGSREPESIPISDLLFGFFRTAHAEEYTHGQ